MIFRKNTHVLLLITSLTVLSGCASDLFRGNTPLPQEATSELVAQKTSMSVAIEPVPDDVGATLLDVDPRTISAGDLILMFLADARQDGEFYYSFSKSTESGFELLKNWHTSEDGQYDVYYIDLFQSQPYPGMEDILGPNDVFLTRTSFFIPFDATHVELRFSSDSNTEFELLERYPLQSYSAWRENILPLTLTD